MWWPKPLALPVTNQTFEFMTLFPFWIACLLILGLFPVDSVRDQRSQAAGNETIGLGLRAGFETR
jgi:hypothetical protein